jgi:hypothetical protein
MTKTPEAIAREIVAQFYSAHNGGNAVPIWRHDSEYGQLKRDIIQALQEREVKLVGALKEISTGSAMTAISMHRVATEALKECGVW